MLQPHTRAIRTPGRNVDDERAQLQAWIAGEADEPCAADPLLPERFSAPVRRRDLHRDDDAINQFHSDPTWGDLAGLLEPDAFPSEPRPSRSMPATSDWRALRTRTSKVLATEVRAWCSIPPPVQAWSRSVWFVLPLLGVLAAGIAWGPRPADLRTLAAYMSESVARFASMRAGRPSAQATPETMDASLHRQ